MRGQPQAGGRWRGGWRGQGSNTPGNLEGPSEWGGKAIPGLIKPRHFIVRRGKLRPGEQVLPVSIQREGPELGFISTNVIQNDPRAARCGGEHR